MITQKEIKETAHGNNVKTKTIDKDWILGHFLNAINKNISSLNIEDFINEEKARRNKPAWINSLANHLPQDKLPEFYTVYYSVKQFIDKILNS